MAIRTCNISARSVFLLNIVTVTVLSCYLVGLKVNNLDYAANKLKLIAFSPQTIVERAMSCYKRFYFRAKAESNNQDKTRSISKIAILTKGTLLLPSIIPSAIKF